jgi:putative acetyltransferase
MDEKLIDTTAAMTGELDFLLRSAREQDLGALRLLHEAAFGQPAEAGLVAALIAGNHERVSLVAEAANRVVGHVLLTELRLTSSPCPPDLLALRALSLAPLAVLPEYQRQGIGSRLVQTALEQAREQGWRLVFVVGAPEYYGRCGFRADLAAPFECVYAGPAFMAIALHADAAVEGTLEYPAPFAAL